MLKFAVGIVLLACMTVVSASATTVYQAGVSDASCNGKQACALTLPVVPAGETLTIEHVSCAVQTSGQQSGVNSVVLSSVKAKPGIADYLTSGLEVFGSNVQALVNSSTLFYVAPGDQPRISISGTATIIGGAGGGCFVSGVESP